MNIIDIIYSRKKLKPFIYFPAILLVGIGYYFLYPIRSGMADLWKIDSIQNLEKRLYLRNA